MRSKIQIGMIPAWLRFTATMLAMVVALHGLAPSSLGSPVMSEPVSTEEARLADLSSIQQMLEQKVVQHRLAELGFTPGEIQLRIEMASNAELHQLAAQSELMMAGGDAGLGIVVTILVIILLVFLILRITSNEPTQEPDMYLA